MPNKKSYMSHKNIELWNHFKNSVLEAKPNVNRKFLIQKLQDFSSKIKASNDSKTQILFEEFLAYFEEFDLNGYLDLPDQLVWYAIEDLIEYDILRKSDLNFERPILKARDLLWELLAFKSNINCSICGDDDLRVLSNKNEEKLHLCCDLCGNHTNLEGEPVTSDVILFPAPYQVIQSSHLVPSHH